MTNTNRLRSPRGSPRNASAPLSNNVWFVTIRFIRYSLVGLVPLALLWTTNLRPWDLTAQIDLLSIDDAEPVQYNDISGESDQLGDDEIPSSSDEFSSTTKNEGLDIQALMQSYNPKFHPVLNISEYVYGSDSSDNISKQRLVQIHYVVDILHGTGPQSKFILDGLERSKYLRVVKVTFADSVIKTVEINSVDPDIPVVFVVDWGSMNRDCHVLDRVLRQEKKQQATKTQIVLIDYSGSARQSTCMDMDDVQIRLVKRNIVQKRYYDGHNVKLGELVPNQGLMISDGPVLHAPIVVREAFVRGVIEAASTPAYKSHRPVDVAMFWDKGHNSHYGFWRRDVSEAVESLNQTLAGSRKIIHAEVNVAENENSNIEYGYVQPEYIRQLLSSKIVVVAQRDEWEDHYRLMESLVSGALVLTDRMLTLPPSIQNKTHLLVYDDIPMLERFVRFYLNPKNDEKRLTIAKNGWKIAMGRHRSWHRIEEVLFGKPLTQVGKPYDPPPPKQDRATNAGLRSEEPFVQMAL